QTPDATARQHIGQLLFANNDAASTGSFVLQINPIKAPVAGTHYELWLRSDDNKRLLDLGALKVTNQRVDFKGNTKQPLLSVYNTTLISVEPDKTISTSVSQQIVLSSTLPATLLSPLRQLFFASELNAEGFLT